MSHSFTETSQHKFSSANLRLSYAVVSLLAVWMLYFIFVLPQIDLYPKLRQDEAQIVDMGRVILDHDSDWSISWLVHDSRPLLGLSYLGNVLQEFSYRLFAPEISGPRVSAHFGALMASVMLLGWLVARKTPVWVAFALSIAFLFDPIFNESYREARVDSWAFAIIIGACWLIRSASDKRTRSLDFRTSIFFAGALTGVAPFFWLTTIALLPLVLYEFICFLSRQSGRSSNNLQLGNGVAWYCFGGFLAIIVCSVPMMLSFDVYFLSLLRTLQIQNVASELQRPIIDLYVIYDPVLLLSVLVALLIRRDIGLLITLGTAILMMYQTMLYPMRILYLLPYASAIIAAAFRISDGAPLRIEGRFAILVILTFLVSSNVWTSAIKRPYIAESQADARSTTQIYERLEASIGEGPFKVLTTEWDIYHAARKLGWKLYIPVGGVRKGSEDFKKLMAEMDYVLTREKFAFAKPVQVKDINSAGFVQVEVLSFDQPKRSSIKLIGIHLEAPSEIYEDVLVFSRNSGPE